MTITELAIKRPTLVVVFFTFLGVLGVFGFSQLKYDLMPKMNAPMINITTIYPGASPYEVENSVTKILEDAISGIDKIVSIQASSQEGRSFLIIEFETTADIDLAVQDAQRKINEAQQRLPNDSRKPVVSKLAFDEIPVLRMAAASKMTTREFYQFIKDKIQPRMTKIGGVGAVALLGGEEREVKVNLDAQRLRAYGLSLFQVASAVKAANIDFPTGKVKSTEDQYVVRVAGKVKTVDEIKNLIIGKSKQGSPIKLSDVADVEDGIAEVSNFYRLNGRSAIGLTVQKQSDANTVEVSKKVRDEIKLLEKEYQNINLKFEIAQDGSTFIMDSADAVKVDLLLAILLVALVMLVFLHSLRNSLIVMVAIPSSLVSTFFLMYIFGFSLNLMTLLAMSLVIGILVDDSIVVLENIYRHLEMGDNKLMAAIKGRNEIGFAALSITLVDVVVFVPLALIQGMIGNFLREYALVVVFSTLMSLVVSFTITPMLSSRFAKLQHLSMNTMFGRIGLKIERFFEVLTNDYLRVLNWSLNHGVKVFIGTLIIFLSSFVLLFMGFIGLEFIPQVDRGELILTVELDPGIKVENTNYIGRQIEEKLSKIPEVDKVLTNIGVSSEGMIGAASNNNSEFYITLVDKKNRTEATDVISQRIKKIVSEIPGTKVRVNPVSLMGTSNRSPIQLLVTGASHEDVLKAANIISEEVRNIEGTSDVRLSSEEGKPELRVDIDRDKLATLGLSIAEVGQNLRIALSGDEDSKYRDPRDQTEYILRIVLDQFDRNKLQTVEDLTFINNKGQAIALKQFAKVSQTVGPTKLERYNRINAITVFSQLYGKTSDVIRQDIEKKFEQIKSKLPVGITYSFIGEQKTMQESMDKLKVALLAGILFVYMIMVALYNSYLYPFVVLFSIPVAMVGAFYGLAVTGKSISIYAMLGLIMLVGLVAKNAILLVDRANQMKEEQGLSTFEALIEAGKTRLRPILMTTFAMIIGMLPIAMSSSAGSETKSGLAVVLIGGLTSSMILTLVLVPVVYQTLDKWKSYLFKPKKNNFE